MRWRPCATHNRNSCATEWFWLLCRHDKTLIVSHNLWMNRMRPDYVIDFWCFLSNGENLSWCRFICCVVKSIIVTIRLTFPPTSLLLVSYICGHTPLLLIARELSVYLSMCNFHLPSFVDVTNLWGIEWLIDCHSVSSAGINCHDVLASTNIHHEFFCFNNQELVSSIELHIEQNWAPSSVLLCDKATV